MAAARKSEGVQSFGGKHLRVVRTLSGLARADLEMFFCEFESNIGIRSLHEAQRAMWIHGGSIAGNPWDANNGMISGLGCVASTRRVISALRSMAAAGQSELVTVLWLMHGPVAPGCDPPARHKAHLGTRLADDDAPVVLDENGEETNVRPPNLLVDKFGELAPLIRFTDAAEEVRARMALQEGAARDSALAESVPRSFEVRIAMLRLAVSDANAALIEHEELLAEARNITEVSKSPKVHAERSRIERRIEAWKEHLARVSSELRAAEADLDAERVANATLRARLSAMAQADLETSATSAIRLRLQRKDRKEWIETAHNEAVALWEKASDAYRAALKALKPKAEEPKR